VAPVAPPVAAPVEAPTADQAEPAADDTGAAPAGAAAARTGSAAPLKGDDDEAVQGAGKSRGRKTGIAGAKHADDSQPAKKAAATQDAEAEPEQTAASKGDGQEVGNDNTDVSVQPHKGERAHAHASAGQHESQKSDTPASQALGTDVSAAAQGANPPSQAAHTLMQANDRVSGPAAAAQAPASDAQVVPLAGLAVEIAARAQAGHSRFEIRLDPPELGRIDVRLDVDTDGNVTSRLVVDRVETLDVLRRDAHTLERALQDAGLKTSDNSLQFSLRDQGFAGRDGSDQRQGSARLVVPDPDLAPVETRANGYGRLFGSSGGIDIRV
jgi:flagellar hook-length control protein FliK